MKIPKLAAAVLLLASVGVHAMGRLADLTITDRTTGRTLPTYWHEGRAYVTGVPGHEYAVALRNRHGEDLAAVVSVDGVNVLDGETAAPSQAGYVLGRWARLDIAGWRKSLDETASFYFTALGDSYAARTDRPDDVGVIGVALFQRARPIPPPVAQAAPADAPWRDSTSKRERAQGNIVATPAATAPPPGAASATALPGQAMAAPSASEPLGTGHGRRETSPVQFVDFVRATRDPVETLLIHYDSHANLVAMGVIPSCVRREPRAFPGRFVPDPR